MLGALWMLLSEYLRFFACFLGFSYLGFQWISLDLGKIFPPNLRYFRKKSEGDRKKKRFFRKFLFFINYMYKSSSTPDTVVLRHCVVRLPSQFMIFWLREPFFWVASHIHVAVLRTLK